MRLRDMFPVGALDNPEYGRSSDSECFCKRGVTGFTGLVERSDFRNGFFVKDCASVVRTSGHLFRVKPWPAFVTAPTHLPPFAVHVSNVFGLCSKPEMVRIYTRRNVASVKHANAILNLATAYHPRNSVRKLSRSLKCEKAITLPNLSRLPQPALIWTCLRDLAPKALNVFGGWVDLIRNWRDALLRFNHTCNVFEFSDALSATTEARCELTPST